MTEPEAKKVTRMSRSEARRLRSLAEQVAALDPTAPDFTARFFEAQVFAKDTLNGVGVTPGNPTISDAQKLGLAVRMAQTAERRARTREIIGEIRAQFAADGKEPPSYRQIALKLNERNHYPLSANKWAPTSVRNIDLDVHAAPRKRKKKP